MIKRRSLLLLAALVLGFPQLNFLRAEWAPVGGEIMTRWAHDVSPDEPLPEYPRPQMVRKDWKSLNGLWDYTMVSREAKRPDDFHAQILVPFPVQSALSGVGKPVSPEQALWYRRSFTIPAAWKGRRVLLHFGAVDWQANVWINGNHFAEHRGGYDAFTLDITSALKQRGSQELLVSVWDPNDAGAIPRGKQMLKPGGTKYTAVSGIWQSVWLEPVPQASISSLKLTPNVDGNEVIVVVKGLGTDTSDTIAVEVLDAGRVIAKGRGKIEEQIHIGLPLPKLWAPGHPFLYDINVALRHHHQWPDDVSSYFGMRKIEVAKNSSAVNRLFLNGSALFEFGPLDQGWWPDGLYTAPTDEALKFDIEETLRMGFNLARKHVKVEPDRWYYWADKLGLLVWQDMPNGDRPWRGAEPEVERRPAKPFSKHLADQTYGIYEHEYEILIESHYNHPCIIMWVPFNEGWGQFDTRRIVEWTRQLDPTRLIDNASGWYDMKVGDVADVHKYPGPAMAKLEGKRASVLGEFGGLGLVIEGHLWKTAQHWGYRNMQDAADLTKRYSSLVNALKAYVARGLSAAIYTQTTDCEGEINGLMTYDRAVNKMGAEVVAEMNRPVYEIGTDLNAVIPAVDMPPPGPRPKAPAN